MKNIFKKMAVTLTIVSLVSVFTGLPVSAASPNCQDTSWTFYITSSSNGKTPVRSKNNTSSVYVHVKNVPYLYISAKAIGVDNLGREYNDTIGGEVKLYKGKYSIQSWIYERGRRNARLNIRKGAVTGKYASGVWSPDSVGKYQIAK